mgnify:CR=1 FL=1
MYRRTLTWLCLVTLLLLDHVPGREGEDVEDPYFGGEEGFAITWDQVRRAADTLVRELAGQD